MMTALLFIVGMLFALALGYEIGYAVGASSIKKRLQKMMDDGEVEITAKQ